MRAVMFTSSPVLQHVMQHQSVKVCVPVCHSVMLRRIFLCPLALYHMNDNSALCSLLRVHIYMLPCPKCLAMNKDVHT